MELGITICCFICNKFSSKTAEIILIINYSIGIISLLIFLGIFKLSIISNYNILLLLLILLISIICLLFSIFFRLWRKKGTIKTIKKNKSTNMATLGIILTVISIFVCIINEYLILNKFIKINIPSCKYNNDYINNNNFKNGLNNNITNTNTNKRKIINNILDKNDKNCFEKEIISKFYIIIIYLSFSCIELVSIIGIFFFSIIRERIVFGVDIPKSSLSSKGNSYNPQYNAFFNSSPGLRPSSSAIINQYENAYAQPQTSAPSINSNINSPKFILDYNRQFRQNFSLQNNYKTKNPSSERKL